MDYTHDRPYLVEHPPRARQYRHPRRDTPSGVIVVHCAENATDLDGDDSGAESVARFIRNRTDAGSYHVLADRDSTLVLVPFDAEAFGEGTGTNRHAIHVSGAYRVRDWVRMTAAARGRYVDAMADGARVAAEWLEAEHGITVPARRITAAAARGRAPGFIAHAHLDPDRRHDPGPDFDWNRFLSRFAAGAPTFDLPPEKDLAAMLPLYMIQADPDTPDFDGLPARELHAVYARFPSGLVTHVGPAEYRRLVALEVELLPTSDRDELRRLAAAARRQTDYAV